MELEQFAKRFMYLDHKHQLKTIDNLQNGIKNGEFKDDHKKYIRALIQWCKVTEMIGELNPPTTLQSFIQQEI